MIWLFVFLHHRMSKYGPNAWNEVQIFKTDFLLTTSSIDSNCSSFFTRYMTVSLIYFWRIFKYNDPLRRHVMEIFFQQKWIIHTFQCCNFGSLKLKQQIPNEPFDKSMNCGCYHSSGTNMYHVYYLIFHAKSYRQLCCRYLLKMYVCMISD